MEFRTPVTIDKSPFAIAPCERMLFVGSCFADNIGSRFVDDKFRATVNPYGVMYNPASILHTVERYLAAATAEVARTAVFTLGTNRVYILNETGEIVDNCQKRPQRLFDERELSVDECADYLQQAVDLLKKASVKSGQSGEDLKVVITVSPIRYAKYGFHGSRLSKATLLLAADRLVRQNPGIVSYFPAYELMNDELRDYRFYEEDMLHPSSQAVEFIWQRFRAAYFGRAAEQFLEDWRPIREAHGHKPFHPDSEAHQRFLAKTEEMERRFNEKYFNS